MQDPKQACQRGCLVVAIEARCNGDADSLCEVALAIEQCHGAKQAVDHGGNPTCVEVPIPTTGSVGVAEVVACDVLPGNPPVFVGPSPLPHLTEAFPEWTVSGHEVHGNVIEGVNICGKEGSTDSRGVKAGCVSAPGRARDARAPFCPVDGLLDHAWVEGTPYLIDELGVNRPPPCVVRLRTGQGWQQALIHQFPCLLVGKP
mmetsp:Transcript_98595/g.307098  ORF Transcript_98595/g.307098 Transcript_98595/m.307098 type:complete len:202 (-) Transcript_98595:560-1165(-)